ncbi:hypothetical protein L3X07_11060 [Levilactobacillus brevis]|nr:hypothetical protein [Levilactobacillus brevis]
MGWTTAMQLLGLPAGFALLASVFYRHALPTQSRVTPTTNVHWKLDRSTTLLALFMGCQSLIFYTLTTWLPTIYQAFGASATEAGTLLSVFQLVGILPRSFSPTAGISNDYFRLFYWGTWLV